MRKEIIELIYDYKTEIVIGVLIFIGCLVVILGSAIAFALAIRIFRAIVPVM